MALGAEGAGAAAPAGIEGEDEVDSRRVGVAGAGGREIGVEIRHGRDGPTGGAGGECGDVGRGAARIGRQGGDVGEAEIAQDVLDGLFRRKVLKFFVELGGVEALVKLGAEEVGVGAGIIGALDGVFDGADDVAAGGGALGRVAGGLGEMAAEGDGAADAAASALEGDGETGQLVWGAFCVQAGVDGLDQAQPGVPESVEEGLVVRSCGVVIERKGNIYARRGSRGLVSGVGCCGGGAWPELPVRVRRGSRSRGGRFSAGCVRLTQAGHSTV